MPYVIPIFQFVQQHSNHCKDGIMKTIYKVLPSLSIVITLAMAHFPTLSVLDKNITTVSWCGDKDSNKVTMESEKLVIGLAGKAPSVTGGSWADAHSQCVMDISIDPTHLPDGWRFKFTDLRWSTHLKTQNGGYVQEFLVTSHMLYALDKRSDVKTISMVRVALTQQIWQLG
jgi:hypothetical protein